MSGLGGHRSAEYPTDVLLERLQRDGTPDEDPECPAARTAEMLTDAAGSFHDGDRIAVDDGLVKKSLDELLVVLVALRSSDANGKHVMGDVERFFGTELSPGTVYPALHDLEERGLLEVHELVQTKEYFLGDAAAARASVREAMHQHLALGLLFHHTLSELDDD